MTPLKTKIEKGFESLGRTFYRHRIKTLLIMFFIIGLLSSQMPPIIDTSSEGMLRKDDPGKIKYDDFRELFGNSSIIVIGIKSSDIFNSKFLSKLKDMHNDLEKEVPYIREITSLINARRTYGDTDTLYVENLLADWPDPKVDLEKIKSLALQNKLYKNFIISEDGLMTAIIIELEAIIPDHYKDQDIPDDSTETTKSHYYATKENTMVVDALKDITARYEGDDFSISLSGGPIVVDTYNRLTKSDMIHMLMVASGIIVFSLAFLFRRFSGVLLPFIIVQSALTSTIGIMAITNMPITLFTAVLPGFLVAVGIADSVHILAIFFRFYHRGHSKEDSIAQALGHSGLAIVMTSLTTAAGLLSFSFSELSALAELGIISAVGVILTLFFTIILLPAFFAITPLKSKKNRAKKNRVSLMDQVLLGFANFSTSHPIKIIGICTILFFLSIVGVFKLHFSHSLLNYLPDDLKIKHDVVLFDENFKGALVIEVVVDTKEENGIYAPEILNIIEDISRRVEGIERDDIYVGKVMSINNALKETHQALNENDPAFYKIPHLREIIAQEFFLFENSGSDDLERFVDSQFRKTRISIKIPWVDFTILDRFLSELESIFEQAFINKAETTLTGMTSLMGRTITAAQHSMAKSYLIAFIVITILMLFLVGDIKLGLLSMAPNLLPIFIVMGILGFIRIPLDLTSLMIGSIAIGLVVDDTMHFMYNFRKYYVQTGDAPKAIQETLLGTGKAIMITSLVLGANFFILMTATLKNADLFGFFTGLVIIIALLLVFLLAPALMVVVTGQKSQGRNEP